MKCIYLTLCVHVSIISRHAPAALPPGKRPGIHCIEGWVSPQGRSGRVQKISPTPGIPSPDGPARRGSLYQLSYPGTYSPYSNVILFKLSLKIDDIVPALQARILCSEAVTSHQVEDVARRPSHVPSPIKRQHLSVKPLVYYHAPSADDKTASKAGPSVT